jgi:adenylate kinase
MSRTIALVGISGVGKSTLIRFLAKSIELQHLSAGSLIREEKARRLEAVKHDNLRLADIEDNQQLLIDGFNRKRDNEAALVILDGHTVIDTNQKLEAIPASVFGALGIEVFIFLQADPAKILKRRILDTTRTRPIISIAEIRLHQEFAIKVTQTCAEQLSISCYIIENCDRSLIMNILKL